MTKMQAHAGAFRLRLRPLAACLAACAIAGSAGAAAQPDAAHEMSAGSRMAGSQGLLASLASHGHGSVTLPADPASHAPGSTLAVTNCNDSGSGSLRDTINSAVSGDTVDLTQLTCSRITLTSGAIVFGQSQLAIDGPGEGRLMIDGGLSGAVLYDLGAGTLSVQDLSIGYGFKYRSDNDVMGSCVHAQGNVILRNVSVSTCNTVSATNHAALGGAVWAGGQAYLSHSTITMSEAHASGYGYASGGGVYALGGLVSFYSTISDNVALSESASTPTFGGGAFVRGGALIFGTTVSGNQAARMGGLALADNNGMSGTLVNSTVSGNVANSIGGVFSRAALNLYNSTIAFNTSHQWSDGAGHYLGAGVYITTSGEMDSTIIANNVNTDPAAPTPTADLTGAPSTGFNGGNNNVMFCGVACPTDTSHEDPGLHPLRDNGGPTLTHVPTPGQWDTFGGTNPLNLLYDQRGPGFPRQSAGDWPEIGALQINSDIIFVNGFN